MNGSLSQLVALTSAANGVLAGRFDSDTFYPHHSDFKFCNSVRFVDLKSGLLRKPREVERPYGNICGCNRDNIRLRYRSGGGFEIERDELPDRRWDRYA